MTIIILAAIVIKKIQTLELQQNMELSFVTNGRINRKAHGMFLRIAVLGKQV